MSRSLKAALMAGLAGVDLALTLWSSAHSPAVKAGLFLGLLAVTQAMYWLPLFLGWRVDGCPCTFGEWAEQVG